MILKTCRPALVLGNVSLMSRGRRLQCDRCGCNKALYLKDIGVSILMVDLEIQAQVGSVSSKHPEVDKASVCLQNTHNVAANNESPK